MKKDLEFAIQACLKVQKIGFEGLGAFSLVAERDDILRGRDPKHETEEEHTNRLASACWMGQEYYRMWLQDSNIEYPKRKVTNPEEITFDYDGVYYIEFAGSESHYFIWIIDGEDLWYLGTYGGVCDIVMEKYEKYDYKERFLGAMEGDMDDYRYIFHLENAEVETVNFEWLIFEKSGRYK